VFVLRREFVAMSSGVQKITGVLRFREQLPQNMGTKEPPSGFQIWSSSGPPVTSFQNDSSRAYIRDEICVAND